MTFLLRLHKQYIACTKDYKWDFENQDDAAFPSSVYCLVITSYNNTLESAADIMAHDMFSTSINIPKQTRKSVTQSNKRKICLQNLHLF